MLPTTAAGPFAPFTDGPTWSKSEVAYTHPARGDDRCADCAHFVEPGACTLVLGTIRPEDSCEEFDRADVWIASDSLIFDEFSEKDHPRGQPKAPNVAQPVHTASYSWDATYKKRLAAQPKPTPSEADAISKYSGGAYSAWNRALRSSFGVDAESYAADHKQLMKYLGRASFPEDAVVRRRVADNFAKYLIEEALSHVEGGEHGQHLFVDHGYSSTDHWSGTLTIEIVIPKGAHAAAIGNYSQHPIENEILVQAGSKYRIDSFDPTKMTMKASLVRSGPAKGGVWHGVEIGGK